MGRRRQAFPLWHCQLQAPGPVVAEEVGWVVAVAGAWEACTASGQPQRLPAGPALQALGALGDVVPATAMAKTRGAHAAPGWPQ